MFHLYRGFCFVCIALLHAVAIQAIKALSKYERETAMKLLDRIAPKGEINDDLDDIGGDK